MRIKVTVITTVIRVQYKHNIILLDGKPAGGGETLIYLYFGTSGSSRRNSLREICGGNLLTTTFIITS